MKYNISDKKTKNNQTKKPTQQKNLTKQLLKCQGTEFPQKLRLTFPHTPILVKYKKSIYTYGLPKKVKAIERGVA